MYQQRCCLVPEGPGRLAIGSESWFGAAALQSLVLDSAWFVIGGSPMCRKEKCNFKLRLLPYLR